MRSEPTLAERKLWLLLRSSRLEGRKFRRQVPMGAFIADFVCHESKVVVEVDGGQHGGEAMFFATSGFMQRVIRCCASGTMMSCAIRMGFWKP